MISWTQQYRRLHKKGQKEEAAKKRTRKVKKIQRSYIGARLKAIEETRKKQSKPAAAGAAAAPGRDSVLKEKEVRKAQAQARKAQQPSYTKPARGPAVSKMQSKGR